MARLLAGIILLLPRFSLPADETAPSTPRQIVIGRALQPGDEGQRAEAEGQVTFLGKQDRATYLEISSESGVMPVTLAHGAGYLADILLGSRVQVSGVCLAIRRSVDGKNIGGLSATNADDITILQLAEETWQRYPVSAISTLETTNVLEPVVHLRGQIRSMEPGRSFLLADETGQKMVEWRRTVPETAGMEIEALCGWHLRGTNRIFQCGIWRQFTTGNQTSLPTLTTAEQIRWLKPAEANRSYPVKIRGVITFLMTRRGGDVGGDLQDGTGGVFLWEMWDVVSATTNSGLKVGDYCELEGVTASGDFSPIVLCRKLKIAGAGEFPEARRPDWDELIHGGLDAQWVEVGGVAVSATNHDLEIGVKGGRIRCSSVAGGMERFQDATVRVRGAVYVSHNAARQLTDVRIMVPSQAFISVVAPAPADPFSAPIMHASDLFTYNPSQSAFQRVKISGQIVHTRDGICYVMDGTNGLRLIPKVEVKAAVGDVIDAVGFPDVQNPFNQPRLTLRDAIVHITGKLPLPKAIQIAPGDLLGREHDSTLVEVKSRLLGVSAFPAEQVLELQTGTQVYRARLGTASGPAPPLPPGSLMDVIGAYADSPDQSVPFELLVNSPADIRVLDLPSWWTAQHAFFVIAGMAAIILLFLIWNGLLRQQVGKRTMELSTANQSLKGEIAERKRAENELVQTRLQHLVEKERTRIARDLHDDLGSRVTRVVLLLDELALQNNLPMAEAPEHPTAISAAAREIIQSLDETVWAVNPRNDTLPHLFNYLSDFAVKFLRAANVRCRLDFPIHPPDRVISTEERHNLFLAVKEALNNAVRHAHATEVQLRAAVNEETLVLTIEDDGCGFQSITANPSADGLRNMRQRMEEIGGQFDLASQPKTGTQVTLTFFWPPRKQV
jgi:signal transduction histidine kinase